MVVFLGAFVAQASTRGGSASLLRDVQCIQRRAPEARLQVVVAWRIGSELGRRRGVCLYLRNSCLECLHLLAIQSLQQVFLRCCVYFVYYPSFQQSARE